MAPEEGPTHARGPSVELQGIWEAVMEDMETIPDDLLLKDGQSEKFKCAVCLEVMLEPVSLVKCGHNICKACATQLLASKTTPGERSQRKCPTCREVGDLKGLISMCTVLIRIEIHALPPFNALPSVRCQPCPLGSPAVPDRPSSCPRAQRIRSYVPAHQFREVIMGAVRVRCVNEGCTVEVPIEHLGGHLKEECAHRR
jgi:hypothetical protein